MSTSYNCRTVNEPRPPLEPAVCGRCDAVCELDDNFCRKCGLSLRVSENLPSVRPSFLPVIRQPSVQAVVVRGAAFVAAGKLAEIIARRMVRSVFQRGNGSKNLPATAKQGEVVPRDETPETTVISETLLTRRIHFRR